MPEDHKPHFHVNAQGGEACGNDEGGQGLIKLPAKQKN
jgi:hypothetical protein